MHGDFKHLMKMTPYWKRSCIGNIFEITANKIASLLLFNHRMIMVIEESLNLNN